MTFSDHVKGRFGALSIELKGMGSVFVHVGKAEGQADNIALHCVIVFLCIIINDEVVSVINGR